MDQQIILLKFYLFFVFSLFRQIFSWREIHMTGGHATLWVVSRFSTQPTPWHHFNPTIKNVRHMFVSAPQPERDYFREQDSGTID